jgi:DNA repair exonuclease SbcCD nuclease subunit
VYDQRMGLFRNSKIAIFSDLHIGVHQDSKFWHDISLDWAKWYIGDLKDKGIEDIVFCGDYFHTRDEVNVDTLHFGTKLLELFNDFNVVMLVGNHDCYLKDSSEVNSIAQYKNWANITIIDTPLSVKEYGKSLNFIPWGIKLDGIPKSDITFGHFEIQLFRMNSFALCDDGFLAEEILEKSPLIFSGHFHLKDEKEYGNGKIIYVGNPFQMDFNDAGTEKGYYTIDLESGETEFTKNTKSPKHFNFKLSDLISEKTITDSIKEKFSNNFIKLKIDRRITPEDTEFLLTVFKSLNPSQLNVEYESSVSDYDLEEEKRDFSGIDVQQAIIEFIDMLDTNNKKDLIQYTIELYQKSL